MNKDNRRPWSAARLGDLWIYSRSDHALWARLAPLCWHGSLPDRSIVPSSRSAVVERIRLPELDSWCFFKRFLLRGKWDWVKHQIVASRARRAAGGAEILEQHGFQAPASLCVIENRRWGVVTASGLITEEVRHRASLRGALKESRAKERRLLLAAAGTEVGRLHAAGVHHGDMNLGNLLVQDHHGSLGFVWLDNERIRRFRNGVPHKLRLDNLRQLNKESHFLTAADRLRFFRAYRTQSGQSHREAARLLRDAARIVEEYWKA